MMIDIIAMMAMMRGRRRIVASSHIREYIFHTTASYSTDHNIVALDNVNHNAHHIAAHDNGVVTYAGVYHNLFRDHDSLSHMVEVVGIDLPSHQLHICNVHYHHQHGGVVGAFYLFCMYHMGCSLIISLLNTAWL